jgi:hypothetical protein
MACCTLIAQTSFAGPTCVHTLKVYKHALPHSESLYSCLLLCKSTNETDKETVSSLLGIREDSEPDHDAFIAMLVASYVAHMACVVNHDQ